MWSRAAREVVEERACGHGDALSGLGLDGAVAAGGLYELANGPAGPRFDPAADRQGGEDDGQVALIESRRWWQTGRACRSCLDIRNDFVCVSKTAAICGTIGMIVAQPSVLQPQPGKTSVR